MRCIYIFLLIIISLILLRENLQGNDRKFTYTYETLTLPPGAREIEIWNTYRTDKDYFFRRLDQRIEFEFGITNHLMSAFYLNSSWRTQDSNGSKPGGEAVNQQEISISSEWKYSLLDRVANPIGLGLYGEATLGLNEVELEGKILLDKEINNFLFAFNGVVEQEWESGLNEGEIETEKELALEFNFGAAYLLPGGFSLGFEIRNHNVIVEREWKNSALFAGPVASYASENWWAALTILPQVTSFKGATKGKLVLDEHEKVEARLLFSFHL